MKKIYLILFFIVVLAVLVFATSEFSKKVNIDSVDEQDPVFCTSDAKMCPDGSYVGRTGPSCEFVCPEVEMVIIKNETITYLNKKILNNGIYITPLEVSDSRCPLGVQCIWAGEVSVKVRLEHGTVVKTVNLKLKDSVVFENNKVSFLDVLPKSKPQTDIPKKDYKFIFSVSQAK
jgi:hypothetical protein